MFFNRAASLVTVAALSALSANAVYFSPPSTAAVNQCDTVKLTFSGKAPFTVSVWDGCDEDSTTDVARAQYHTNETYVYWKVNVASGKSIMWGVEDATGDYDWTDDYTVAKSDVASCIGVSPSFSQTNGTSTTSSVVLPTTATNIANAGGLQATTTYSDSEATTTSAIVVGGGLGGAMSNFSPRAELVAAVIVGSSIASFFF